MSVHWRAIGENRHVAARHPSNHHVAISRTNQDAASQKEIAGTRFVNFERAAFVQALREHFRETFGHVLHHQNRGKKIRRNLRQNKLQGVRTTGGNSNGNDAARRQRGAVSFFRRVQIFANNCRGKFAAHGALGNFYFCDQLVGDIFEVAGGSVFGFSQKIHGAHRQGFERGVAALFRMRAEEDDRQRSAPHDKAQHFHAVHARHLQVERNDIRLQLFNFLQSESAIHRCADNFDGRIARKYRRDPFAHERGITDDRDSDTFARAIAPSGVARESRERTAGTLRMRTTVPSPRMEAPLTKSLETISPGSALMTSSSSPTRLYTTRPKRFSAALMTIIKCFFRTGCVSMLRKRLRWYSRSRVRICARRRSTSRWSTR